MGLKEAFESLLRMGKSTGTPADTPVSMVLLLKEPRFPSLETLREAAAKAFGVSFQATPTARHSVYVQGTIFTMANVGPHTLSFLFYTKPYGEQSPEFGNSMPLESQRKAWAEHKAWMAIDYARGRVDIDSKYVVLARLCTHLYDDNCVGLYLPRENAFVPGRAGAGRQLAKIVAYRDVVVT
jgi:hypothetical protein